MVRAPTLQLRNTFRIAAAEIALERHLIDFIEEHKTVGGRPPRMPGSPEQVLGPERQQCPDPNPIQWRPRDRPPGRAAGRIGSRPGGLFLFSRCSTWTRIRACFGFHPSREVHLGTSQFTSSTTRTVLRDHLDEISSILFHSFNLFRFFQAGGWNSTNRFSSSLSSVSGFGIPVATSQPLIS